MEFADGLIVTLSRSKSDQEGEGQTVGLPHGKAPSTCPVKAIASAAFGRPSGDLTERANHPTLRGIVAAEGDHMMLGQGAMPIIRNGVVEGACGVGGGTAQEDEDCARAGVDLLQ